MRFLKISFLISALTISFNSFSQSTGPAGDLDSLKNAVINLQLDVDNINASLDDSRKTLKTGIFIATLGYTVTIIGGQLLTVNQNVGEALLYTGGAIGIGGTFVLIKGFNKLGRKPQLVQAN